MRILKLTPTVEKNLLRARQERDREAEAVAARIIAGVRRRGDAALFAYTAKFDGIDLRRIGVWLSTSSANASRASRRVAASSKSSNSSVSPSFLRAIAQAARNIRRVAEKQLPQHWSLQTVRGVAISQHVVPIDSVGCYIPGGNFALVSTLLMTAIPAQVAGVKNIIVVCPRPNAALLAAANFLGIPQVAQIGGAQAIAALAYGTQSIPRVEKICGPGNRFVTAAKQIVSSDCGIDLPAGPTEAIVLAASGNPTYIAADLLAQAEHAADAGSFLLTPSRKLANAVQKEIASQLAQLLADNPAHSSIQKSGAILLAPSLSGACDFINRFAPEHLSLPSQPDALLKKITASGTIFLGPWAAQPLGDYVSGSNHVLPTGGWARKRAGLSSADFVKCITTQTVSRNGFLRLADAAESLAQSEGLLAHRNAVRIRRSRNAPVGAGLARPATGNAARTRR
jgi:histidinol dehydrogenase